MFQEVFDDVQIGTTNKIFAEVEAGMREGGFELHAKFTRMDSILKKIFRKRGISMEDFIERRRGVRHYKRDGHVAQLLLQALEDLKVLSPTDLNTAWERVLDVKALERNIERV